jgi:hypothetical protein
MKFLTQILVHGWAAHDEALQEFYVYCALESMFTKEDKLERESIESSDLYYEGVWSETGEWPESPIQETKEDQDIEEFLKIWTGV